MVFLGRSCQYELMRSNNYAVKVNMHTIENHGHYTSVEGKIVTMGNNSLHLWLDIMSEI